METISSHKDLKVWEESLQLVELVYQITKALPDDEKYGISSQLKRAVISVPANISEGFARKGKKELIQFLYVSLSSLSEVETYFDIIVRLKFYTIEDELYGKVFYIRKMLSGLIQKIKSKE